MGGQAIEKGNGRREIQVQIPGSPALVLELEKRRQATQQLLEQAEKGINASDCVLAILQNNLVIMDALKGLHGNLVRRSQQRVQGVMGIPQPRRF